MIIPTIVRIFFSKEQKYNFTNYLIIKKIMAVKYLTRRHKELTRDSRFLDVSFANKSRLSCL